MPTALPENTEEEPQKSLMEDLSTTRYMLFAERTIVVNRGDDRRICRALLPIREKNGRKPEEPILTPKEVAQRKEPFRPFRKRDFTPIPQDPFLREEEINNKTYSQSFTELTRRTVQEALGEEYDSMEPKKVEQWAYRQCAMLQRYGGKMDPKSPTSNEVKNRVYSNQLTQTTRLSLETMLGHEMQQMSDEQIEQWAQWELERFAEEKRYIRDFTTSVRQLKKIIDNGWGEFEKMKQKRSKNCTNEVSEKKEEKPKIKWAHFREKIDQIRQKMEEKDKRIKMPAKREWKHLIVAMESSLLQALMPEKYSKMDLEIGKKLLRGNLAAISRTANDHYSYLKGKYFNKSQDVALNAEVEECHNIGELFLMAFDPNHKPKVRREAANKLILIIIFLELEDHSQENNGAMKKMVDIFNQDVFIRKEGQKTGDTDPDHLFFDYDGRADPKIGTADREPKEGEGRIKLQRRLFAITTDEEGNEIKHFVTLGNRTKDFIQRLNKVVTENTKPGEGETDLNGFRFMVETIEDQQLLMGMILKAVKKDFFDHAEYRIASDGLDELNQEERKKLEKWLQFSLNINEQASDEEGKLYLLNTDPIPISGHKIEILRSPEVIHALDQDITQSPVFITEFKNSLNGEGFDGRSGASSSKLRVLKFKLHVANHEKPGHYHQYEMQFYLPKGYADMLHDKDIRHARYGIGRIFEKMIDLFFPEELYGLDLTEAKTEALKREAKAAHAQR